MKKLNNFKKIKENFSGINIDVLGTINSVSYTDNGECLIINMSGDVPMAMKPVQIVMVHPDANRAGWVGLGGIGIHTFEKNSCSITKIPLCGKAAEMIKEIYLAYTGKNFQESFWIEYNINKMTFGSVVDIMASNKTLA